MKTIQEMAEAAAEAVCENEGCRVSPDLIAAEFADLEKLQEAVKAHHAQKADDRCWLDDADLYDAAGLPPYDMRVGDKEAMLANCRRFLERRCAGGKWKSYAELEATIKAARLKLEEIVCTIGDDRGVVMLSNDGPTHYDAEAACQVYDHEFFSPLGDALIALHDLLFTP